MDSKMLRVNESWFGLFKHWVSNRLIYVYSVAIAAVTIVCYWNSSSLFFIADDFLWLERAKFRIPENPLSIFQLNVNGMYFDPLVNLSFWINSILFGLNPVWYHRTDILIHITNSLFVLYLTLLLTQNSIASFFSGLIFALIPANADAVFWPSVRTSTLAALFYLGSIILYIKYCSNKKVSLYLLSVISFILSLSAKPTPILLPAIILALEITSYRKDNTANYKTIFFRMVPFVLVSITYLFLLFYMSPQAHQSMRISGNLNTTQLLSAITVFFFPESFISTRQNAVDIISISLFAFIVFLGFRSSLRSAIIILIMIAITVVPLLFLRVSYVNAIQSNQSYYVLGSISHRLYLGVIGFSMMTGISISFIIKNLRDLSKYFSMIVFVLLFLSMVYYSYAEINSRWQIWRRYQKEFSAAISMVKEVISDKKEFNYKRIYISNAPVRGFMQEIVRLYTGKGDLDVISIRHYSQIPNLYSKSESLVWVGNNWKLIDITKEVRRYQQLTVLCGIITDKKGKSDCIEELSSVTIFLNSQISN